MLFAYVPSFEKNAVGTKQLICEAYAEDFVSADMCEKWFRRFKSGNFNLDDKPRLGRLVRMKKGDLDEVLKEDLTQSTRKLTKQFEVDHKTILTRLQTLGKMNKENKWVPHVLSKRVILDKCSIYLSLFCFYKKKSFLSRIVTGDEN